MTTHTMPIFDGSTLPDTSGNAICEPSSVKDANDLYPRLIGILNDSGTKIGFRAAFKVPVNYVGSARIKGFFWANATTGDVVFDFDYRAIADGESADPSTDQENATATVTTPGTARLYKEFDIALTSANLAARDVVQFLLARDGVSASDTLAAAVQFDLDSVVLEYADA